MIKDFLIESNLSVAKFWNLHWQKNQNQNIMITKSEEYALLKKYLVNKKMKILDVGCGLGHWVEQLNAQYANTQGCELSKSLIQKINRKIKKKATFVADIRNPKTVNKEYDLIFSWGAFEHFESGPGDCLRGCKKILAKDGVLIFSVPYQNWRLTIQKCIFKSKKYKKAKFYQYRFTKDEIYQELANLDLEPLEFRPIHSVEGLKRFLHHYGKVQYDSFLNKSLSRILAPISGTIFCHMVFVACKSK